MKRIATLVAFLCLFALPLSAQVPKTVVAEVFAGTN